MKAKISLLVLNQSGVLSKTLVALRECGFTMSQQQLTDMESPEHATLAFNAEGNGTKSELMTQLTNLSFVVSLLHFEGDEQTASNAPTQRTQGGSLKTQCKSIIAKYFGADAASSVDQMTEESCVTLCRLKVAGLVGENEAKVFDQLIASDPPAQSTSDSSGGSGSSKKTQCKALMTKYFGSGAADAVDQMTEEECVSQCRAKVAGLLGENEAQAFDKLL